MLTQITHDPAPMAVMSRPRVTTRGKNVTFHTAADLVGSNADGSLEVLRWKRKDFEKGLAAPTVAVTATSVDSQSAIPGLTGRRIVLESASNPVGENADGNVEIFTYDVKANAWTQLTHTAPPYDSRRPATAGSGRHVIFDSTGDLDNDPGSSASNADGNREVFRARSTAAGPVFTQLTNTQPPVENRAGGGLGKRFKIAVFSSNGDLVANGNADGNREVFVWFDGQITQVTNSVASVCEADCMGDADCLVECGSVNPVIDRFGRFVAFESTADLDNDGAENRRVYLFSREEGTLLRLSRSRFGENRVPRISNGRFVVWESTADLTGGNPSGDRVIYMFDRRKDD
jgi:hypothetical protein